MLLFISYSGSVKAQVNTLNPTQVYTTGNVVQPTPQGGPSSWVNGVYQDNLTCFGSGMPGYCGPNPIVRPGSNINFSYGQTDLFQSQSISSILPYNGNGLRVNGYNFSFTAKNGNGWDDGRVDYLTAYVNFYDSKGNTVFNKNYNLNYKFNWSNFNYSENFTSPMAAMTLGNVQYGFVGRDNNSWAGPYGPEVTNVGFSLKYSVDPCFVNVLSSPSCPGYLDAIAKLSPQPTALSTAVNVSPTLTATIVDGLAPVVSLSPAASGSASSSSTNPASSLPQSTIPTASNDKASSSGGPSLSMVLGIVRNEQSRIKMVEAAAVSQANEVASSLSAAAKELSESVAKQAVSNSQQSFSSVSFSSQPDKTISNTSISLLTPAQLQKFTNIAPPAPPVTNNVSTSSATNIYNPPPVVNIVSTPSVVNNTSTQPVVNNVNIPTFNTFSQPINNVITPPVVAVSKPIVNYSIEAPVIYTPPPVSPRPAPQNVVQPYEQPAVQQARPVQQETIAPVVTYSSSTETRNKAFQPIELPVINTNNSTFNVAISKPAVEQNKELPIQETVTARPLQIFIEPVSPPDTLASSLSSFSLLEIKKIEPIRFIEPEAPKVEGVSFAGLSPIKEYLDEKPKINIDTKDVNTRSPEVKRNVVDNDAAMGVSITAMAKTPQGFELYSAGMKDIAFYQPKEIYKNQRVIDNQRILRQINMRSDRIHEEMVSEQYKNR